MYDAKDVAKVIIEVAKTSDCEITNLKLQKVLYYVQANFLVHLNRPCFGDDISAWRLGPVVPSVYYEYAKYGSKSLSDTTIIESGLIEKFNKGDYLRMIAYSKKYIKLSPYSLVNKTHSEKPWSEANPNGLISNSSIKNFYSKNKELLGDVNE